MSEMDSATAPHQESYTAHGTTISAAALVRRVAELEAENARLQGELARKR